MEKLPMLELSPRDRDRLQVWPEAGSGQLTPAPAGAQLQRRGRWVGKLVARLGQEGDGGILPRRRGRASQRKIPEAVRRKAVKLGERQYQDFGPRLAAEYLAEKHRRRVSQETLRQPRPQPPLSLGEREGCGHLTNARDARHDA